MPTVKLECFPLVACGHCLVERRHVAPHGAGLEEKLVTLRGPDHARPESATKYVKRLIQGVACLLGARTRFLVLPRRSAPSVPAASGAFQSPPANEGLLLPCRIKS